ncbi:MAG: hypothetical protein WDO06_08825 [Actinomycetota bacterium]
MPLILEIAIHWSESTARAKLGAELARTAKEARSGGTGVMRSGRDAKKFEQR